jgi:uncharacterized radical SAM superfamily Fe-S cluster-containing enzyme
MKLRDYSFLGTTQSLCPECLALVPAKIITRGRRVYFRKRCAKHGEREDFVCSDVRWFDRMEYSLPGKLPVITGVQRKRACPYDCGLCEEHEQHTCIGLLEITSSCNLKCPMCFAGSAPGGKHLTFQECQQAIDRLVEVEGRPEVLQLSGGEPTIHPEFIEIFRYACSQPIDVVMINTNGLRLALDAEFRKQISELKHRCEIYLQFDGFDEKTNVDLRGVSLLEKKMTAIDELGKEGVHIILVCTLQAGLNEHEIGRIVEFGLARPWITGVSFQPATYTGRHFLPTELEQRITFPDIVKAIQEQTEKRWIESDFLPLPCAHPNAHSLAYAYRSGGDYLPLTRFIDIENHLDLLANGITFNRQKASQLIGEFLSRQCCGEQGFSNAFDSMQNNANSDGNASAHHKSPQPVASSVASVANDFFTRALSQDLSPEDVFRITTTSFMDAYNFDVRQLMKSCVHHILPSGHIIPFSAYNVLYRDGHVPLPELSTTRAVVAGAV